MVFAITRGLTSIKVKTTYNNIQNQPALLNSLAICGCKFLLSTVDILAVAARPRSRQLR